MSATCCYAENDRAYDLGDVRVLLVSRDGDRLDKELVSTFCVKGRVFSHGLQQD